LKGVNMKYIDALKIYNQGKSAWCTPRKGTKDYFVILGIMEGKKSKTKSVNSLASSPKDVQQPLSSSNKPTSKSLLFKKANVIQRFLKNKLILAKNNLDTRVQRYQLIKKRFNDIPPNYCLKRKKFGNDNGFTVNGVVNLEKKIGEAQAEIYLTSIPHILGSYPIASKIMEISQNNECETKMNEWITENLILTKQSKHFILMYKTTKCPLPAHMMENKRFINDYPKLRGKRQAVSSVKENSMEKELSRKERLVNYNELCNGDLSSLMKTDVRNDEMLMYNIMMQSLIAIATYQNRVGYCHRDCHHGNFLYQLNNEIGYYHYVYNGFHFYIKSCKYNILLFDFGESSSIHDVNNELLCDDYIRILYAFMSEYNKGWKKQGWIEDSMDKNVNRNMMSISTILKRVYEKNKNTKDLDMFQEIINRVFKKIGKDTKLFTTTKPVTILNDTPFIINKVKDYPVITFHRT